MQAADATAATCDEEAPILVLEGFGSKTRALKNFQGSLAALMCKAVFEHAVCTCVQGQLAAAEERLQGLAAEKASLEAQLKAAQLQASIATQVALTHPSPCSPSLHLSRRSTSHCQAIAAHCEELAELPCNTLKQHHR